MSLAIAQANLLADPERREPDALLAAWHSLPEVAEAVAGAGGRVVVLQAAHRDVSFERGGVVYRFFRAPPMPRPLRGRGPWSTPVGAGLAAALRDAAPDVVHVHGLGFPRHVRAIRSALPETPILVQDHGNRPPRPVLRPLFRRGLACVDAVAFTAPEQVDPFREARLIPAGARVFAIPESSSRFTPGDVEAARKETGLYGDPCLLWLGHLDANKDPLTVLEALSRASSRLRDPRLWMAFLNAPLRGPVEARIAEDPALTGRVHLVGPQPRPRVEALLRAADFLVQGSHREGSGYAVIEALAVGTAPIVTDIPPFRALTGDGAVGFLSPPGDPDGMAESLVRAAEGDARALGREARRHFEGHLSFEVVGRRLMDAYRSLIP